MDLGLTDKVALVAASSKGLGRAVAMSLSQEGAKLAICGRHDSTLEETAREIRRVTGNEVLAIAADLATSEGCHRVTEQSLSHYGALHVLVTNNGGPPPGEFSDFADPDWQQAVNLTLMSTIRLIRACVPVMQAAKWGRIINIASISVKQPLDGLLLSNSLRPAVVGLAKTLANQLTGDGITVNNVLPGPIATDRMAQLAQARAAKKGRSVEEVLAKNAEPIPVGRIGQPEEFAAVVAFLASEQAAFVNGTSILVDGGMYKGLM